ncbi:ATP-binding protein [Campylobacter sp. MIT 97-5078]|uniref:ATP-binding protein n=1 Tax=Campylobacter sp. MIT 97-5078 TaxID=1548153 RepID=UPI00051436EB|nr:ATP-binding protein [Campylobacter sp. MIT 97-5078]KGI55866.1 hypothetical protein LR59_10090 [Campylobacter sp. MIT 97-5078]KGI56851.1 hypothetical protein LR59_05090 [Campylobacter sp. MIT 97-5078]TQR25499.1 ATP-binding protein [Campylobacter sp. MIT 97-5078]
MSEVFVPLHSQLCVLNELLNALKLKRNLILLVGKSGSGKSILLHQLQKEHKLALFNEPFTDENAFLKALSRSIFKQELEFKEFCLRLKEQKRLIIALDELGMYEKKVLEKLRVLSDIGNISFILSTHKMLDDFHKEHFKSRISSIFELSNLSLNELEAYLELKHKLKIKISNAKWLFKLAKYNLRTLDKLILSFKDLQIHYKNKPKSEKSLLELSALYHNILG